MALADCYRALFACSTIYRSTTAVIFLECPPPMYLTAVPMVWKAFHARETTLFFYSEVFSYTDETTPFSSFPITLPRVKTSR
ncbi:hypothetical protein TNCV_1251531 [Trichonephila clavipes]|nr:hypothetical protein TNCV_1251531 [Trichonephila clavipes]